MVIFGELVIKEVVFLRFGPIGDPPSAELKFPLEFSPFLTRERGGRLGPISPYAKPVFVGVKNHWKILLAKFP